MQDISDAPIEEAAHLPKHSLLKSFFARPRPIHFLIMLVFVVFGTALVTQVRTQQVNPLDSLSESELVELLAELDIREGTLETQKSELTSVLSKLDSEADQLEAARTAAAKLANQADISSGLVPVKGPGIVIGITQPSESFPATVFVSTLAELRNAGAESIDLNGVRLTLRSWFAVVDGEIVVDGVTLTAPYTWRAIGDSDKLSLGIEIRDGAAAQLRNFGSTVTVKRRDAVIIDSVVQQFVPQWAQVSPE